MKLNKNCWSFHHSKKILNVSIIIIMYLFNKNKYIKMPSIRNVFFPHLFLSNILLIKNKVGLSSLNNYLWSHAYFHNKCIRVFFVLWFQSISLALWSNTIIYYDLSKVVQWVWNYSYLNFYKVWMKYLWSYPCFL